MRSGDRGKAGCAWLYHGWKREFIAAVLRIQKQLAKDKVIDLSVAQENVSEEEPPPDEAALKDLQSQVLHIDSGVRYTEYDDNEDDAHHSRPVRKRTQRAPSTPPPAENEKKRKNVSGGKTSKKVRRAERESDSDAEDAEDGEGGAPKQSERGIRPMVLSVEEVPAAQSNTEMQLPSRGVHYYTTKWEDSTAVLNGLAESVQLVLTDPPYGTRYRPLCSHPRLTCTVSLCLY